jgi:hypothetical protein
VKGAARPCKGGQLCEILSEGGIHVIDSRCLGWAASLWLLTGLSLIGQSAPANEVPLKNWATPLYWQPNQMERENTARSGAQIQFSPNATSTTALIFVAVSPCRLVDTRGASAGFIGSTPFNGPYIQAQQTVAFPIQSATETNTTAPTPCGAIPSIAQAYSLNLTLVPHPFGTPVNYVTMWPDNGSAIPNVSTLNDQQGSVVANSAIVPAGTNSGGIKVFAYGATDVIVDMNGFYAAPTDLSNNTAIGVGTLSVDTTGTDNTAIGSKALQSNTSGTGNTASGTDALLKNTSGYSNTANGAFALANNTMGLSNTASGSAALSNNTTGNNNTAIGADVLTTNTSGNNNVAMGSSALLNSTTASNNTAVGFNALQADTTGGSNTAIGLDALLQNQTGINNIAIGSAAADLVVSNGSDNIHIGNQGGAGDDHTIKIGTQGTQSSAFVGGISGASVPGGAAVYINSNGQLGTNLSSQRFKEKITDMNDTSKKLLQLRPVNFFYKPEYDDGSHLLQYGLIAEEVEKVYPEMVAYDSDGRIMTVKYQMLAPMLLNEAQKQNAKLQSQAEAILVQQDQNRQQTMQIQQQGEQNQKLVEQIHSLEERLAALEALLSGY